MIATGNYLNNNKNSAAENTSQDFTSLQFPESFEQFKLLESELLFDTHYTSVAVKGSDASDLSSQVLALHSSVRIHSAAATFTKALPLVLTHLKATVFGCVRGRVLARKRVTLTHF
jgi:hypothetical protein